MLLKKFQIIINDITKIVAKFVSYSFLKFWRFKKIQCFYEIKDKKTKSNGFRMQASIQLYALSKWYLKEGIQYFSANLK